MRLPLLPLLRPFLVPEHDLPPLLLPLRHELRQILQLVPQLLPPLQTLQVHKLKLYIPHLLLPQMVSQLLHLLFTPESVQLTLRLRSRLYVKGRNLIGSLLIQGVRVLRTLSRSGSVVRLLDLLLAAEDRLALVALLPEQRSQSVDHVCVGEQLFHGLEYPQVIRALAQLLHTALQVYALLQ